MYNLVFNSTPPSNFHWTKHPDSIHHHHHPAATSLPTALAKRPSNHCETLSATAPEQRWRIPPRHHQPRHRVHRKIQHTNQRHGYRHQPARQQNSRRRHAVRALRTGQTPVDLRKGHGQIGQCQRAHGIVNEHFQCRIRRQGYRNVGSG